MGRRLQNYLKFDVMKIKSYKKYKFHDLSRKFGLRFIFLISSLNALYGLKSTFDVEVEVRHDIQIIHQGISPTEPIACTLVEIQNEKKQPIAYYMEVESVVCGDSQCKVDIVKIYWDNLGQFDRLEMPEGVDLEKAKGEHFSKFDYLKLAKILKDKNSPLKEVYKTEIVSSGGSEGIDGISGATVLVEKNAFVEGAVWTCYSLWHWVHGETQHIIRNISGDALTNLELQNLLTKDSMEYQDFAIDQLTRRKDYSQQTVNAIKNAVEQQPRLLKRSLNYWDLAPNPIYTKALSHFIQNTDSKNRLFCLTHLLKTKQKVGIAFFNNLSSAISNLSYPELTKFLSLLEKHSIESAKLNKALINLLEQDNFIIARRIYWFLSEQQLSNEEREILETFFLKHEHRL